MNSMPLSRMMELEEIGPDLLYDRIAFLAERCRIMAAWRERELVRKLRGKAPVLCTDVQRITANWRHASRVLNVPILHAVTVDAASGYVVAPTMDYDPDTEPGDADRLMASVRDDALPRAWRRYGRVWGYDDYRRSLVAGASMTLTPEERFLSDNAFDIPGRGARVRADLFQAAHMMRLRRLTGTRWTRLLHCIEGDTGLAKMTCLFNAEAIIEGRAHVADVRFTKELGNRKRNKLVLQGGADRKTDIARLGALMTEAAARSDLYLGDGRACRGAPPRALRR